MKWLAAALALGVSAAQPAVAEIASSPAAPAAAAAAPDHVQKGSELVAAGDLEAALAQFEKATVLDPEWGHAHAQRAIALFDLGRVAEADAAARRGAALDPEDPAVSTAQGLVALELGRLEEALAAFSQLADASPRDSWAASMRGKAYELLGRLREAASETGRAAALEPGNAGLRREQARILAKLGDTQAALAAADGADAVDRTPRALTLKAYILADAGRAAEAAAARAAAVAKIETAAANAGDADELDLIMQKVSVLSDTGNHAGAIAAATAGIRRHPRSALLLSIRCLARTAGAIELTEARRDCDRAIAMDPADPSLHLTRALLALRLRDWDLVASDCQPVIDTMPRPATCTYARGLARLAKGETEAGKADLEQARRYETDIDWDFRRVGLGSEAQAAAPAQ
jgi:tetratricopeptide (TPR) repeat protein